MRTGFYKNTVFIEAAIIAVFLIIMFNISSETVYNQDSDKIRQLEYDLVRIEDTANIALAIREYLDEHNALPESLGVLETEKYLFAQNIRDPENNLPYFYKKRAADFVLCVYLRNKVKGVNTEDCPEK